MLQGIFLQAYKQRSSASHITLLKDQQRQVHTREGKLEQICYEYYHNIYMARTPFEVVEET